VNAEPTPFDDIADAVLREAIGDVLPRLVRTSATSSPPDAEDPSHPPR
jgi:NAD-dependent SIR2 family protein deacetylase